MLRGHLYAIFLDLTAAYKINQERLWVQVWNSDINTILFTLIRILYADMCMTQRVGQLTNPIPISKGAQQLFIHWLEKMGNEEQITAVLGWERIFWFNLIQLEEWTKE